MSLFGLIRRRRERPDEAELIERPDESIDRPAPPNPAMALAAGLVYVFRTAAGARIMRELEGAMRKYAADPAALWRLVREGDGAAHREDDDRVIDTTIVEPRPLPPADE